MTAGGALARIASGETLPSDAMATLFAQVFNGDAAPEFVAGLLMALKTRGETVEDLVAPLRRFRRIAWRSVPRTTPSIPAAPAAMA
ncbi:hypothetical protein [Hankyongella ginsenosidimutans]|uniref:hypothetical protein n=1 Tax=Hankyongella ginsenosidimutans TaxID=1763828 RepID=UPI001FE2CABB|nr:hypothetical protein [Hankyongella ginsenosidimutans]